MKIFEVLPNKNGQEVNAEKEKKAKIRESNLDKGNEALKRNYLIDDCRFQI